MRVALIQSEMRQDRSVLFHVARALREQGHEPTLIVPQLDALPSVLAFADEWRAEGFAWLPVTSANLEPPHYHFPKDRCLATARRLFGIVEAFDVAWFLERHWAMPSLRARRFRDRLLPVIVLDSEPDPELPPKSMEEINRAHSSRYALRWADLVCSGCETEAKQSARCVEKFWRERSLAPAQAAARPATSPAVTVCVPYFEAPALLPETLRSLERQTSSDFTVVVVDDGSYTEEARRAFDACAERYAARGWRFLRQPNLYVGAARNRAAREAATEFLLFLDSDDLAMPSMVERFLRAALLTGDDCLVVPNYGFLRDPEGPCALLYDPPGNSLIGSMADDMHGGSCIFARREAFLTVGGFMELRGVGFDDYEFHVRCNLAGLRWDVLPELIYRYRMGNPESVSQSTSRYKSLECVRKLYEQRLLGSGLEQLPLAVAAAFWRNDKTSDWEAHLESVVAQRLPKLSPSTQRLKLLLLTCYFPFGSFSGWHKRVQEMIRYFGSRYELTLVAPATPALSRGVQKESLRHLHLVRAVKGGRPIPVPENTPSRVRELYMDSMQSALRALPTKHYHAALIDQIFLAEFRHDIETTPVLTEHNIESRLLRRAAVHSSNMPSSGAVRNPEVEAERFEQYEDRTWPDFPVRAVTSEVDRAQMSSRCSKGKVVVSPNGADPSTWLPDARHDTATALFTGQLAYFPNVDAVEFLVTEIWPHVRRRNPQARLIIAGRDPGESIRALVRAAPGVELIPNPKSMARVAKRASITVAPLRIGSGTRIKITESMAWGLPVVSTTLGCEGIEAFDGEHLLVRDDPEEFGDAIVALMSDAALWRKLRYAGRDLIRDRYSWDRVFEPLEKALIELCRK
jgi:glycosyltransferase involved in cell wall biosynthesis/GT2 family glycosyltransferase